ncbi:MAG TPA: hydroxymethylbilane synthase, partial [Reyranella sp.]
MAALKLGTRGSKLALTQAGLVRDALARSVPALAAPDAIEIVVIKTTGDAIQDRPLSEAGGKGLFVKEIEEAMLARRIDIAVHSMKDMPTAQPAGLAIAAFLAREDARDVLIAGDVKRIADLGPGAVVGTSALRRRAQLLHRRPDLKIVTLRGNVDTRVAKREAGEVEATILALAGLKRLGLEHVGAPIPEDEMLPAVGQGAICIECRADDAKTRGWLAAIDHGPTAACVKAEHAMLSVLDGSCRTPIAGHAM